MMSRFSLSSLVADMEMLTKHRQGSMARIVLGLKAIALGLLAQLLMFGLEMAIELSAFPFPSSILAMLLISVFLLALGCFWDGLEEFYVHHLRQPVRCLSLSPCLG
jgi:hypothetical protein